MRAFPVASVLIHLDPGADAALHRQLFEQLRAAILEGTLAPGDQVPASRALAADLGVSRTTVLRAIEQLKAEGYVTSTVGSGTRVARILPERLGRVDGTPATPRGIPGPRTVSARGTALAATPSGVARAGVEPRAFRLGIPALDLFPRKLWNRLVVRRARLTSVPELDYGPPAGIAALREAIARHVASARGVRCAPRQVVVVGGAQQAMSLAVRVLLDPGDEAWLEEPGYLSARSALAGASVRVVPVPVDAAGIDVGAGLRRAPGARLAFVTPSHQYPLGVTLSLPRRLALLEWARSADAWILEDDYDSEFRYGERPLMALQGLDRESRVVYIGTFSKSVFPSLRIGYLVVPEDLVETFTRARMHADQHPPTLQQLVLAEFLEGGHFARHVRRMRRAYELRQNALLDAWSRELAGVSALAAANAGLHLVAHLPPDADDREVSRRALARGIEASPLSIHYLERPRGNGLLLGFAAVDEARIREGVRVLARAIRGVREAGAPAAGTGTSKRPGIGS